MGIKHCQSSYLCAYYLRAYKAPLYICREYSTNQLFITQNKANFPHFSPENEDYAKKQTQFKPNQTQLQKE